MKYSRERTDTTQGRHDIRHNEIQHNDTKHNEIQNNDAQYNHTQHDKIKNNDAQHNNKIRNTQHKRHSASSVVVLSMLC